MRIDSPPSISRLAIGAVGIAGIVYGSMLLFAKLHVNRPWQVIK